MTTIDVCELPDEKTVGTITRIIARGVSLLRKIRRQEQAVDQTEEKLALQALQGDMEQARQEIVEFFATDSSESERLVTPKGTAERKVTKTYELKIDSVADVRDLLGGQYNRFIDERTTFGLTSAGRKLLSDGDSQLGQRLRELVQIKERIVIAFIEP